MEISNTSSGKTAVDLSTSSVNCPPMARNAPRDTHGVRDLLSRLIDLRGENRSALSLKIGRQRTYLHDFIERGSPRKLGEDDRLRLADALDIDDSSLRTGRPVFLRADDPLLPIVGGTVGPHDAGVVPIPDMPGLPVRFRVGAGLWQESFDNQAILATAPIVPDPAISHQWAEEVVGDSFDLEYPEGSIVHVRDAFGFDPARANGAVVIVERLRDGGALRERTLKQIEVRGGRVELWPRSKNPRWRDPIRLDDGARDGEDIEVRIAGIVIGGYRRRTK